MSFIAREDGTRFVTPSYRDVISAKKGALLKKEILSLSSIYGEYVALQHKNVQQYEIACSPDSGFLLGETVWHYFKRPVDLIYCEQIPNTTEAILVVVKSGSVYIDGSFPMDAIPDELVVFRSQQNNFEVYVYGDVPISQTLEENKFTLDSSSIRLFKVLDQSVFQTLPKIKNFQLQRVDAVLSAQGIGVFPVRQVAITAIFFAVIWFGYLYISSHKKILPPSIISYVNPYQTYITALKTPDPAVELHRVYTDLVSLYSLPGWIPSNVVYSKGRYQIKVISPGVKTDLLFAWAKKNFATVQVTQDGFYLNWFVVLPVRSEETSIYKMNQIIASMIDKLATIIPGENMLQLGEMVNRRNYVEVPITINFIDITPSVFDLIGAQLQSLPVYVSKVSISISNGNLTGTIALQALGY